MSSNATAAVWWSGNRTNATVPVPTAPDYSAVAFQVVVTVYVLAMLALTALLMVATVLERTVPPVIRLMLVNIQIPAIAITLAMTVNAVHVFVFESQERRAHSELTCRFVYFAYYCGNAARLTLLTLYYGMVYIVVRDGITAVKPVAASLAVVAVWSICTLPNLSVFSGGIWLFGTARGHPCIPISAGVGTQVFTILTFLLYGVVSIGVSAAIAVAEIVYVRRNTIMQDRDLLTKLLKFAFLLLVAETVTLICTAIPLFAATFEANVQVYAESREALSYVASCVFLLSLLPLPVFLIVAFDALRQKLHSWFCCVCSVFAGKAVGSGRAGTTSLDNLHANER